MIDFAPIIHNSGIQIKGVIHIGACDGLEKEKYNSLNIENIIWIEANPEFLERLRNKVGNDTIIICAIGNENKETFLNVANNGQSSSILEFGTHLDEHPGIDYVGKIKVDMKRMIDVIKDYDININLYNYLSIDVQGYELEVIKGFEDIIKKFDFIYTEVNEKELYKNCVLIGDLDEYLEKFGFERIETYMTHHGWGDAIYKKIN